jgi:hypothetical protein
MHYSSRIDFKACNLIFVITSHYYMAHPPIPGGQMITANETNRNIVVFIINEIQSSFFQFDAIGTIKLRAEIPALIYLQLCR